MTLLAGDRNSRACFAQTSPAVSIDGRLLIDLGGTFVEIESADEYWLSKVCDRYGSFMCQSADVDIRIVHSTDETTMMNNHGCLSILEPGGLSAKIACVEGTEVLDGVLRTLLPSVIAPNLMIHGALLADDGQGFLCSGLSGSGKSTIAALFPMAALCDELARLHLSNHGVTALSLPFWNARPASVELSRIFLIEHGAENLRIPLRGTEGIKALRRHVYWPVEFPEKMSAAFETLTQVCDQVPIFRLAFRPDVSVWQTMTEGL